VIRQEAGTLSNGAKIQNTSSKPTEKTTRSELRDPLWLRLH
jgi:hypothetical protein